MLTFTGGQGVSAVGDGIYLVALTWTALTLTHSSVYLGLLLTTSALPRAILMLGGGVLVDRWGARRVILGSDLTRAILVGGLAALVALGHGSIALLFVIAGVFGVFDALFYPATMTLIPALVEPGQLSAANGVWQMAVQGSMLIGPPLGGVLVGVSGPAVAFAVDGASFLVAFGALMAIRVSAAAAAPTDAAAGAEATAAPTARQGPMAELTAGLRAAYSDPFLRAVLPVSAVMNLAAGGPLNVGLPLLARAHSWGPEGYGALFAGIGAGVLIGGLAMSAGLRLPRLGVSTMLSAVVIGVFMAGLGLTGALAVAVVLCALIGALIASINVTLISMIQRRTEPRLLGRVSSVMMFSSMSLTPVSYALAGAIAHALGAGGLFVLGAVMVMLVALVALGSKEIRSQSGALAT
ncbi:MAG: MFS transporter [Candidatus Dormiibacterota bacterium]